MHIDVFFCKDRVISLTAQLPSAQKILHFISLSFPLYIQIFYDLNVALCYPYLGMEMKEGRINKD
jgi:hypothetical protein